MTLDAARIELSEAREHICRLENGIHNADCDGNWVEKLRLEIALTGAHIWRDIAEQKLIEAELADAG